jgi:hypothetical protein
MKRTFNDDSEVRALAERLGAWPTIAASIRRGHSGAVIIGEWVIGYFTDGLIAIEASNPLEAVALAGSIVAHLGGPVGARFTSPAVPSTH